MKWKVNLRIKYRQAGRVFCLTLCSTFCAWVDFTLCWVSNFTWTVSFYCYRGVSFVSLQFWKWCSGVVICRSWRISASGGRGVCDCEWAPAAAGRRAESGRYRRARRACAEPLTCCREVVEVERYSLKLGWTPDMYWNKSKVFDPPSQRSF